MFFVFFISKTSLIYLYIKLLIFLNVFENFDELHVIINKWILSAYALEPSIYFLYNFVYISNNIYIILIYLIHGCRQIGIGWSIIQSVILRLSIAHDVEFGDCHFVVVLFKLLIICFILSTCQNNVFLWFFVCLKAASRREILVLIPSSKLILQLL